MSVHLNEISNQAQEKFIKKSYSDDEDKRSFATSGDEDGKDQEST